MSTYNVKSNPQGDLHCTHSDPSPNLKLNLDLDQSQNGFVWTCTLNILTSMGHMVQVGGKQEAVAYLAYLAPLGVKYLAPSVHPDHKNRGRDREWVQDQDRDRDKEQGLRNAWLDDHHLHHCNDPSCFLIQTRN
ncbi:hypothetical protein JVT61DRAFT_11441 [Boletus reticuloceps]|uniref:Uncharacterized protein n=1 Tax=Boletus reticuloceps TaxID=495285 RepID=A0A8I2YVV4_9AGAM|nr:hypothetical protein JVT61DRAFT_11441 [Boletus reticuloceps]